MAQPAEQTSLPLEGGESNPEGKSDAFFDGYMTAIAVCPQDIPAREWLAIIPKEPGVSLPPAGELHAALMEFRAILTLTPDEYAPQFMFEKGDRRALAQAWAAGFMCGMKLRPAVWHEIMLDDLNWIYLDPVAALARDSGALPELVNPGESEPPLSATDAEGYIDLLPKCVTGLNGLFLDAIERAHTPIRYDSPKIGRNEPCPCGSGKKYKKCCGA
jgi:uncharacterized protein